MPAYLQLFLLCCTIGEIEIDQRLVWNAGKFSLCFLIFNNKLTEWVSLC